MRVRFVGGDCSASVGGTPRVGVVTEDETGPPDEDLRTIVESSLAREPFAVEVRPVAGAEVADQPCRAHPLEHGVHAGDGRVSQRDVGGARVGAERVDALGERDEVVSFAAAPHLQRWHRPSHRVRAPRPSAW